MTAMKTMIVSRTAFFLNPESNIGTEDSTHLSQREQNFKPLDISRTVPWVIASQAYRAISWVHQRTCSIGNKYLLSVIFNFFEVHSRELFLY